MIKKAVKKILVSLIPRALLIVRGSKSSKQLYLTFDDGPTPGVTDELLEVLDEYGVHATFFVIGTKLESAMALAQRCVARGHLVGNHSYDHQGFGRLNLSSQLRQFEKADALIDGLGQDFRGFRAPQGHWSMRLLWSLFRLKAPAFHWSYDSMDYTLQSEADVLERFRANPVVPGEIILFHDDNRLCIDALKKLIPEWKQQGYQFSTLERIS